MKSKVSFGSCEVSFVVYNDYQYLQALLAGIQYFQACRRSIKMLLFVILNRVILGKKVLPARKEQL